MILYLDTSALVKKYFEEKNSSEVVAAWKAALGIATSSVSYAELLAAVYRKASEAGIHKRLVAGVVRDFEEDWSSFIVVEVNNRLNETIHKVIASHALRGFDAIHLASALVIASSVSGDFLFACYDDRLNRGAVAEGLHVLAAI
jgi:predicted nucleic acid-binding protein